MYLAVKIAFLFEQQLYFTSN